MRNGRSIREMVILDLTSIFWGIGNFWGDTECVKHKIYTNTFSLFQSFWYVSVVTRHLWFISFFISFILTYIVWLLFQVRNKRSSLRTRKLLNSIIFLNNNHSIFLSVVLASTEQLGFFLNSKQLDISLRFFCLLPFHLSSYLRLI